DHWVVEPEQALSIIGDRTGHYWGDLCAWNRDQISDCDRIYPGQRFRLFSPDPPAAEPSSAGTYRGQTPVATWERLAECESGGGWAANPGSGCCGGGQLAQVPWVGYGGEECGRRADLVARWDQMTVAKRVYRTGYAGCAPQ